jgi:predicted RNA polymerase sigma factor
MLARLLPRDDEVKGLLALMLVTHARRDARTDRDGGLVPLAEQDRSLWDHAAIAEGIELVDDALGAGAVGTYQLQAAIAAAHADARIAGETDWREITVLYETLEAIAPNPIFTLNRAVAVAMYRGPEAGLDVLETVASDQRFAGHHRIPAVRGHLLEMTGDFTGAATAYEDGARLTTSLPERDYLRRCAATALAKAAAFTLVPLVTS